MTNFSWDLEGLDFNFDLNNYDKWYSGYQHLNKFYNSLISLYKESDCYQRSLALNLNDIEFTTSEPIFKSTGIYGVFVETCKMIDIDDLVYGDYKVIHYYCTTDVLNYFYEPFKNIMNSLDIGYCNLVDYHDLVDCFRFHITDLGFIDKKNVDGNKLYTIYSTLNNKNVFCEGISKEEILSHFGL